MHSPTRWGQILYEKSLNLKTISEGDFGQFRENLIMLSNVVKIALKIVFKLKRFPYKIDTAKAKQGRLLRGLAPSLETSAC